MPSDIPNDDDELLSAYVDGELTPAERLEVEARLRSDPAAARLVDELRRVSSAVKALPRETLGRDLTASIEAEVRRRADADEPVVLPMTRSDRVANVRRGLVWSAIAIAAALLLTFLGPQDLDRDDGAVAKAKQAPNENLANRDRRAAGENPPRAMGEMRAAPPLAGAAAPADERGRVAGAPSAPAASTPMAPPGLATDNRAADDAERRESHFYADAAKIGEAPAAAAASDASSRDTQSTIVLAVSSPDGVARFHRLLAEHRIALAAEAPAAGGGPQSQLSFESAEPLGKPAEVDAAAPADRPKRAELAEQASEAGRSTRQEETHALRENAALAEVLVEAPPEVIEALVAAARAQSESYFAGDERAGGRFAYHHAGEPASETAKEELPAGGPLGRAAAVEEREAPPAAVADIAAEPTTTGGAAGLPLPAGRAWHRKHADRPQLYAQATEVASPPSSLGAKGEELRAPVRGAVGVAPTKDAVAEVAEAADADAAHEAKDAPAAGVVRVLFILRPRAAATASPAGDGDP